MVSVWFDCAIALRRGRMSVVGGRARVVRGVRPQAELVTNKEHLELYR